MQELFDEVLEKDEEIIKVIKPNKKRYLKTFYWMLCIPIFWPHILVMLIGSLFTLPFLISKGYKNTYYAYTNKRLIVRTGMFANSYDSLEYEDITSTSVSVGFLDRKTKTGSLIFVSPSSHHEHPMTFANIENPYEMIKEIKEQINTYNNK